MDIEVVHQLAAGLHSSPRIMACVLGSGVSRAAQIPTGWEIVLDLVRRLAASSGAELSTDQEILDWFSSRHGGGSPDYSEIVHALASESALQRNLLDKYFMRLDPATRELRERQPTAAHHAIAKLVRRGLIRVIITTNFDRLMEAALSEAGVAKFEVVSTEAQAANCYPFHAADAFVFKIHGDWRDVELRNSTDALAKYPPGIQALLNRILDEHGLIICGWSAEYDVALRASIQAYNRRFPIYWIDPKVKEHAAKLSESLKARHVPAVADQFFPALEAAVGAIARLGPPKRLHAESLLLRAEREIERGSWRALDTLVAEATRDLTSWILARTEGTPTDPKDQADQLEAARRASEPICRLAAALAHDYPDHKSISVALTRLLEAAKKRQAFNEFTDPVACYPAVLLGFTWGIMRAESKGWHDAIAALQDPSARRGDLTFPPGSNKRMSPYRAPKYEGRYKESPQQHWGDYTCAAVFEFCEERIVRRGLFEELYDKLDLLIAVRSATINDWWFPRKMVDRGIDGEFTEFKRNLEWLEELIIRDDLVKQALFAGLRREWSDVARELRRVAQDEQIMWRR